MIQTLLGRSLASVFIFSFLFSILGCSSTPKFRTKDRDQLQPAKVSAQNTKLPPKAPLKDRLAPSRPLTKLEQVNQLESEGQYLPALQLCEQELRLELQPEADSLRMKGAELIQTRLTKKELEDFADYTRIPSFEGIANFKLGELALEEKDRDAARKYFSRTVSASEDSEFGVRAKDLIEQLDAVRRVEPKTIGVVLPLSGKNASVAQKTLRGLQMGFGLYNNYPSTFKLAVVDSEGNPDYARRGVERLVKEDNVIAIVGSILSKTASAVASKANELGVPSIALSQKAGITETGPTVFRNSLTSEMQVRQLAKVAVEDLGLKKFAILYSNDLYGVEYSNIFWDEVMARGGEVTGAQIYSPKETDFREVIQRLVGTYFVEARADEYRLRLKQWQDQAPKQSQRQDPPDDLLPPIVDFDAIFIPDSVKSLGQISAMLSYNGVKDVKLLGTNLWNNPGLQKRSGHFSDNLLFVDSFSTSDNRFANSQFVKEYRALFGEEPGVFEIQAYDTALLIKQLISMGNQSRESLIRALGQTANFPGSLGSLTVNKDREYLRPIIALTLENGSIVPYQKKKLQ